ncbi:MAG: IS110 family transposase [Ginsengibacter sp.]
MKKKSGFPVLYPNAAGIDIASREHYVAVNPTVDEHPTRSFGSFTEDLYEIANWLLECKVDTVAMEATGIYWISLYLILEDAGLNVVLVNAKHVKNVSGKKSDVKDAEWIRQLHSCGLLSNSFQPDGFTRTLRTFMRHRKNLTEMAATHIRMMQKAMEQMNIKLQNVIADITGKSGQRIIAAILQGERRPEVLIQLLDGRIKASREEVCKSLKGIWKEENLFELRQSFEIYQIYRNKVQECDEKIKIHLETKTEEIKTDAAGATKTKVKSNKNNLSFDATEILAQIIGTDVTKIYGITDTNAIEIISEIGLDMNKWPTAKHFTAWLNLAPNNKVSGGKVLSSRIQKKKNRAGQIFKMAAFAVQRSKNWLAIFYHRLKSKRGTAKALVATARKIAIIFYKLLKEKISFNPLSEEEYMETFKQQKLRRLKKQAALLGLSLVPNDLVT